MNIDELKPCPFCGAGAQFIEDFHVEGFMDAVSCLSCDACILSVHNHDSRDKLKRYLVEQWNRRT